jgi:hypothetical protein
VSRREKLRTDLHDLDVQERRIRQMDVRDGTPQAKQRLQLLEQIVVRRVALSRELALREDIYNRSLHLNQALKQGRISRQQWAAEREKLIQSFPQKKREIDRFRKDNEVGDPCIKCAVNRLQEEVRTLKTLSKLAQEVNPGGGGLNCAFIVDAIIDRLTGANPLATAPVTTTGRARDLTDAKHGVVRDDHSSFEDAFEDVTNGGHGAIGIIGISRPAVKDSQGRVIKEASGHVLAIVNIHGKVVILEGQGGGKIIEGPEEAKKIYDPGSRYNISFGMTNKRAR